MGIWDIDAARIAKVRGKPLDEAARLWDRSPDLAVIEGANRERQQVLKSDGTWYQRTEYASEAEAWEAVRAGFVRGFELART